MNKVLGQDKAPVNRGLKFCTIECKEYHTRIEQRDIIVVDTPGFNRTSGDSRDVLKQIVFWLDAS